MKEATPEPRVVGPLLMLGMVALPIVFCWITLRRGYAPSLRKIVFVYTFYLPALFMLTLLVDAGLRGLR